MAKVSEPVIKIVIANKPKWLTGLDQKVRRLESGLNVAGSWSTRRPVDSECLTPHCFSERNVETPYSCLLGGKQAVRRAHGGAGMGCRKKRTPSCNGLDTGFDVTRRESEPTSDGSFLARECVEPSA